MVEKWTRSPSSSCRYTSLHYPGFADKALTIILIDETADAHDS